MYLCSSLLILRFHISQKMTVLYSDSNGINNSGPIHFSSHYLKLLPCIEEEKKVYTSSYIIMKKITKFIKKLQIYEKGYKIEGKEHIKNCLNLIFLHINTFDFIFIIIHP